MDVDLLKTGVEAVLKMYSSLVPIFGWFGFAVGGALGVLVTIVVKMGIDVYRVSKDIPKKG